VVVLFQSKDVLTRPWCLLELYAAVMAGIPIVSLVCSGKGYDFAAAEDYLLHLDTSLPMANPSAVGVLEAHDAPVLRVAQVLWACLPNIISVPLNSSGSENAIHAAVADLVNAMQRARPFHLPDDEVAWLEDREKRDEASLMEVIERGTVRGTLRGRMLQKVERMDELAGEVAELKGKLEAECTRREAEAAEHKADTAALNAKRESEREKFERKIEKLEAK